jgi:single-strand DNA-binding protein
MSSNSITIVGNVTRNPELKFVGTGLAIARFSVAVSRKVKEEEKTSFFDVSAFGSLAENVANSVLKGTRVIVQGTLEQSTWETEAGEKKSKVEIKAEAVGPDLRFANVAVNRGEGYAAKPQEEDAW